MYAVALVVVVVFHRLLLSLDTTRERLKSYGGQLGLDYLKTVFLPKLRAHGVSDEQITQITVHNPAAALAIRLESTLGGIP